MESSSSGSTSRLPGLPPEEMGCDFQDWRHGRGRPGNDPPGKRTCHASGFTYLFQKLAKNGSVPMTVIRDKKRIRVDVPAPAHRTLLIPALEGADPSYVVYGPIVFSQVTSARICRRFAILPTHRASQGPLLFRLQ